MSKVVDKVEEVDNVGATPFDQYKGHPQVQDSVQAAQDEKEELDKNTMETSASNEVIDIDLNDPDVEHAATKIQAGFKGMKARKDVQSMKDGNKVGSDKDGVEKTTISPKAEEEKVENRQHDEKDTNEVQAWKRQKDPV